MVVVLFELVVIFDVSTVLFVVNILIKNSSYNNRQSSKRHIIESDVKIVKKSLSGPSIIKSKEKLRHCEHDIFVVEIENHFRVSNIRPSTMNKQQFPQILKFSQSKIRGLNSPHTFLTIQSHSNMSLLYHINIIGPISNGQSDLILVLFDEPHNFPFLFRTHSTTNHRIALRKDIQNVIFGQIFVFC